ncbi:valine--tRNA ligase [Alphaproteobacteria bacterium]|nr:valine--tRNA ligase [Alphaproteobacteria bacterium]
MKLNKTYQPGEYEPNVYALWEASGTFSPTGQGEPYSIVMPPPNANGNLHIGHALFVACEDVLTRYYRMRGRDTVWIPGADHAGFETWVVFEKYLESQGKSRFDYTRDQLYQMTWDFVAENRGNMEMQLRALGASCDWSKQVFTLDDRVTDVVFTTFKKLWDDGLIYRGERIVNYCTYHDTSFADIEVEHCEEKGKLWYIKYPLVNPDVIASAAKQSSLDRHVAGAPRDDESEYIIVATTRPETMLGDEAVAVNPNDKRYAKLVGQKLTLPLVGKEIPIIADEAVEYEFGTGAVKVTPAHDPTDFDIGQRHNLPITSVIGHDGLIIEPAPSEFVGLSVEQAREQVVEQLTHLGLISKIEDYNHQVPHCYKCGRVIQPLVKDQWFVSVKPLAERAVRAIKDGKIKFTPAQKGEELIRYFSELRDWNISRQIPWGIPIPAFRKVGGHPGLVPGSNQSDNSSIGFRDKPEMTDDDFPEWIFDTRVDQEEIIVDGVAYKRDNDTFDTWFSSGQWPYIVTRGDLTRFYPNSVMETGVDILRPWVARMIMLGLYVADEVPFSEVYLHGLVNDEHNQKMSKSKGNVINPMDIIDEYGSDAMRMGILANRSAAMPQAFSPATVIAGRNFCNKLWNIARYIESSCHSGLDPESSAISTASPPKLSETASRTGSALWRLAGVRLGAADVSESSGGFARSLADNWVFRQLDTARKQIEKYLAEYRFAEAYEVLYHVIWDDVADWYVESSKLGDGQGLQFVLEYILKLAHPFAPFVTEAIWQSVHNDDKSTTLLILQQWPEEIKSKKPDFATFESIKEIVRQIRNIKAEIGQTKGVLTVAGDSLAADNAELIKHLARLEKIVIDSDEQGIKLANTDAKLVATDEQITEYYDKLDSKIATIKTEILKLESRLKNKSYVANAPEELVRESKLALAEKRGVFAEMSQEIESK